MKRSNQPIFHPEHGRRTWPWRPWLAGAILVLLVTIVYLPTLGNGFVSDDEYYVEHNLAIRSLQGLANIWFKLGTVEQYYPLVFSTFWVEYHLWGLDPQGYHVVNLLLHATCVVLVWRLLSRLSVPGAWLAAAIFALHPVEVESVAWVSERKNVLSCVLALGSLLAYLRFSPPEAPGATAAEQPAARRHWLAYALALALYVAALLAKTVTATVPAVLLVIYWWKRGRVAWRDVALTLPFFAVGLALGGITIRMEKSLGASGEEWDFSPVDRVLMAGRVLWFYAGKLAWPHPLMLYYPRWVIDARAWWQYLFPAAAVSVIALLWLARTRLGRGPLAAVLIFAGVLTPALGFVNVYTFRFTLVSDHYQYHASIALIALAAAAAVNVVRRLPQPARWLAPVAGVGLLLPLGLVARQRTYVYKEEFTLDADIVAKNPQCWLAQHNLGVWYREHGRYDEAVPYFRKAIEILAALARDNPAISRHRNDLAAHIVDIGFLQRLMGRVAEEEISFREALEIRETLVRERPRVSEYQDGLAWCYADLAVTLHKAGRLAKAIDLQRKAIAIREKLAQDFPAVSKYREGVAACHMDIGFLERDMGRPAEAAREFLSAIEIRQKLVRDDPSMSDYQLGLGWSYAYLAFAQQKLGRAAEAATSHRKVIEVREALARDNPTVGKYQDDVAAGYVDLGLLLREAGRAAEAEHPFRKAIEIRQKLVREHPQARDYQDGLAWCYVDLALAQHDTERTAEAVAAYRRAIEIRRKQARDDPTNATCQSNLARDLTRCGEALALLGRWSQSTDMYAQAAAAGNDSWQTMGLLALLQLAAGDLAGYRATCADLVKRHADDASPDAATAMALALVVGDKALDDMSEALALAMRAADADPSNPMALVLVGAAQYRAGRGQQAIATLTGAGAARPSGVISQVQSNSCRPSGG